MHKFKKWLPLKYSFYLKVKYLLYNAVFLSQLDDNDKQKTPYILPEKEKMDFIVETLYKCLGINLLGIDFIIDNKTGHYAVVDINVFPGKFVSYYNILSVQSFMIHFCLYLHYYY